MIKRNRFLQKRPKSGKALHQPPGTVTYVGSKERSTTLLEVMDYNGEQLERFNSDSPEDAFRFERPDRTSWINIDGLSNTIEIEKLGKYYELHPLIMEDIVNTNQRPKIDEYPDYIFIVAKMLYFRENGQLENEHISFVLGKDYVLTFQEAGGDVFDGVRERLVKGKGRIRSRGADYLVFALLDAIVDNYFVVIEEMIDKIEVLEEQLLNSSPSDDTTFRIQDLKRTMLRIRRAVLPLREVVSRFQKSDHQLVQEQTSHYIGDLNDHMVQITENIEIYREMSWGLMDMYMTTISNKMNEVMKVLTIMASIFIPLTFLVGVYGMNFEYMPELEWKYSYPVLLGFMFLILIAMLLYFKRKRWL